MARSRTHSREIPRDFARPGAKARALRDAAAPLSAKTRGYYKTLSATSIGIEMAAAVLIALFFGRWLDGKLGTTPWLMFVCLLFGFAAGMKGLFRYVRADARDNDEVAP